MPNPKQKGNRFEADTAKMLSERFKPRLGVKTGFYRNIDSGSAFGGSNVRRMETHNLDYAVFGDIVVPRDFRFVIECKHYSTAPKLTSIFTGNAQWDCWIKEAEHDSKSSEKDWLLVMKYDYVKPMIICEKNLLSDYEINNILIYGEKYAVVLLDVLLELNDSFWFEDSSNYTGN